MGLWDNMNASKRVIHKDWRVLNDLKQLDVIDEESKQTTIVLFKDSTTCGISASVKYRLEGDWAQLDSNVTLYYLDLLSYRPISNAIAERYGVVHQSPQIIIVKGGRAVYNISHHRISVPDLNQNIVKNQ